MPAETSDNPFCTRRIRPGAIPFFFPAGCDADTLVARLRDNGWSGEIVGIHGSGKSALLATLIPTIERGGRHVTLVELHDGQRRLPPETLSALESPAENGLAHTIDSSDISGNSHSAHDTRRRPAPAILVIDGYEQLSRWRRWLLRRLCRRRGWGLLVTAHASVGLPPLWQTAATPELAEKIVDHLAAGKRLRLGPSELAECLARHHGDLRETLFHLYDRYEETR
jgi:hypothetical protein